MKSAYKLLLLLVVVAMLAACGATEPPPTDTPPPAEPTQAEVEATEPPEPTEPEPTEAPPAGGLTCEEPVKVGLITDKTGVLAIYGEMIERSFLLGMEYAAGAPGTADNVFTVDNCEIQVLIRDDQSNPETTATIARELIEVEQVDMLV
ncbi:MAG: ABC transporter substrate-binding protein, partial [Anaerolineae bacterium]|nr:ABC transporter substrate-binding protein [Anaerolineae bacterium]